jgi:hypothetical protein
VDRVLSRNRIDPNSILADDIRRLARAEAEQERAERVSPTSEPRTDAAAELKYYLHGALIGYPDAATERILTGAMEYAVRIEAEATEPAALLPRCPECGFMGRKTAHAEGCSQAEPAASAVPFTFDPLTLDEIPGYAEVAARRAAEPAALDVEQVKRAIFIVADNEEYDLQYTKEVHRLANDVAARLQGGPTGEIKRGSREWNRVMDPARAPEIPQKNLEADNDE